MVYIKSHKKVFEQKQAHVGWNPQKSNKTTILHIIPTSVQFCQLCLVFVICMHGRVVEASGMGSAGCVVHGEVVLWVVVT